MFKPGTQWKNGRKYPPTIERFQAKIQPDLKGCWIWTGSLRSQWGYGQFRGPDKRVWTTHKFAYHHFKGPIPKGMEVCHRCDVPACCNPEHLFLGTHKDNMDDMRRKGRDNPHGLKRPASRVRRYSKKKAA